MTSPEREATSLLTTLSGGDSSAAAKLLPPVYAELRRLAGGYFRGQPGDHTLQPTALVHEAFIKLIDQPSVAWTDRAHFFAVAATAMRQILIDHAGKRAALKRGGDRLKLSLDEEAAAADGAGPAGDADLLALDEALENLSGLDERKARVVELRYFGGMTNDDIAHVLGISTPTVERDWRMARAWLSDALREAPK